MSSFWLADYKQAQATSDDHWREIALWQLEEELSEGLDLTRCNRVHVDFFSLQTNAAAFAAAMERDGYVCRFSGDADPTIVPFVRERVWSHEDLLNLTDHLLAIARTHGVVYDGWFVISPEEDD